MFHSLNSIISVRQKHAASFLSALQLRKGILSISFYPFSCKATNFTWKGGGNSDSLLPNRNSAAHFSCKKDQCLQEPQKFVSVIKCFLWTVHARVLCTAEVVDKYAIEKGANDSWLTVNLSLTLLLFVKPLPIDWIWLLEFQLKVSWLCVQSLF